MDNISFAHGFHAFDDLGEVIHGFFFGEFGMSRDIFRQITPFAILKENVEVGLGLFDIDKVDDMLVFAVVEEVDFSLKNINFVFYFKNKEYL